jgi:hypothetical protein
VRRRRIEDRELLAAIAEVADDGFAPRRRLKASFPRAGQRDLAKAGSRLARRGLVLERRGPDGAIYLALTGEGWRALG